MSSQTIREQHALVIALIIVGILITAFFGMRVFHSFIKFPEPRPQPSGKVETDVTLIRDWMTIPFISRMYGVPENLIFEALNFSPKKDRDKNLKSLNQEYYPNKSGYVLSLVKEIILAHQPAPTVLPTVTP